jgi:chromosome segregation ATPase
MKTILATLALTCFSAGLFSCVSHKKYVAASEKAEETQKNNIELTNTLKKLEDSVAMLTTDHEELSYELYKTSSELNITKEYLITQKMRILQMQAYIKAQKRSQEDLKYKVAGALVGFNAKELSVSMKNGRIYVILQNGPYFCTPSDAAIEIGRRTTLRW